MNPYDYYITPEEYKQAEAIGIRPTLLEARIRQLAWPKARALSTPPHSKKPLKDWVEVAAANGICYSTLRYRANRLGWDIELAATQPLQDRSAQAVRAHEASRKYPVEALKKAIENGIPERTFHRRMKTGWDAEEAATRPPMTHREVGLLTKSKRQWSRNLLKRSNWQGTYSVRQSR
ncbi:hypothetical protein SAMN02799630_02847 [Paenibacillus sp. UNCCL117]|uniref:hypothetical protein n=1 Tax=unclassified Paenibacillus TaxID=185978 RepID=UPI00088BC4A9|nr:MULTISPECIES: hypothetical protein [unclassified Paenibacillus]SDD28180.1 hypothetical protein SAMN04488602_107144 [Paenibacillus sp. cl123]SFW40954.1 hypothetical protein SAMN02799630_02847 [Paenibacillus sp. UNCCL117]